MTAHVASVLRRGVTRNRHGVDMDNCLCAGCLAETTRLLNLLAAENYAVVKLPEGVAVLHGTPLLWALLTNAADDPPRCLDGSLHNFQGRPVCRCGFTGIKVNDPARVRRSAAYKLGEACALLDAWCVAAEDGEPLDPLRQQTLAWLAKVMP